MSTSLAIFSAIEFAVTEMTAVSRENDGLHPRLECTLRVLRQTLGLVRDWDAALEQPGEADVDWRVSEVDFEEEAERGVGGEFTMEGETDGVSGDNRVAEIHVEEAERGVSVEAITESETGGLSGDDGGQQSLTTLAVSRRVDTAIFVTGRARGDALPHDVLVDLFENVRKVDRRMLVAASTVCRRWSAPARAALLRSILMQELERTAFFALSAVMRKYRVGDAYAASSPIRSLFIRNTGLPTASTRAVIYPLFANVRRLSIQLPFDPDAEGATRGPIDMSVLAPLLIACPHLTSLDLCYTTLSDFVPLPESKWVAVEGIIAGLENLKLPAQIDGERGASAVARMSAAVGVPLQRWELYATEDLSHIATGLCRNLKYLNVSRFSDEDGPPTESEIRLCSDIGRIAPAITHLTLTVRTHLQGPLLLRVLPEVTVLDVSKWSLGPDPQGTGILRVLRNHKPLTSLKMSMPHTACDIQDLLTLLRLRGSQLSRFEIFGVGDGWTSDEITTTLAHTTPNLETLRLCSHIGTPDLEISFEMLDSLKANCPKLFDVFPPPRTPGPFPEGIFAGHVWRGKN
ncbi:hypothetical protein BDK51DRAFT_45135 [Blyttiomyces helicus]|uniref:F-box domain-containing protein n=1 Tax=Blyttiomyces helicus TaxID=388810 RepID=A0A4P9WK42_9FUNG|nr:hypothetical protein BDK51DRAFT_45135 [Blyttiomyces helicus]|eukprot:RKO91918.1 hypothetical protein BDK51DRAFT_45135 [Blyttiomyces helicus]